MQQATKPRVYLFHTITTIRPQYFSSAFSACYDYFDDALGVDATRVDIGALFWTQALRPAELVQALNLDPDPTPVRTEFGLAAIEALDEARNILGRSSVRLAAAPDLVFCYRVVLECARIASLAQHGFKVHIARGLVALECDQRNLSSIIELASRVHESAVGRSLDRFLATVSFPEPGPEVCVINLRNDGELYQAVSLAAWLKMKFPATIVILDTAGGNEQYNFGEWTPVFQRNREQLSRFLDYFLPRQDYHLSLRELLQCLLNNGNLGNLDKRNIVMLDPKHRDLERLGMATATINDAFEHYALTQPVFYAGGRRTLLTRLSADKCHWAACKFCTINTQHLMPRGRSRIDENIERNLDLLVDVLKTKRVESLILTDEALHPAILLECARRLLAAHVRVLVRARARFTDDLTLDACQLLARAGIRFLGMGLESASPRINALFDKHFGQMIDYQRVLANLDAAGINAHIYAILGFPSETAEETALTRDFLFNAIRSHRYVTVSANTFFLMRGSRAAADPQSVGITRVRENGDVGLVLEYDEDCPEGKAAFAQRCANEIFEAEFMPGSEEPYMARGFWSFIDQSGLFYTEKIEYGENPYRAMAQSRSETLESSYADDTYVLSRLVRLRALDVPGRVGFFDWVTGNYGVVPGWLEPLLEDYNSQRSFRDNVDALIEPDRHDEAIRLFPNFYSYGFFRRKPQPVHPTLSQRPLAAEPTFAS